MRRLRGLRLERGVVMVLVGVAACGGHDRIILEKEVTHHARITGVVTRNGSPIANVAVVAYPPSSGFVADLDSTDAAGRFDLEMGRIDRLDADTLRFTITVLAMARPPIVSAYELDSGKVQATFVPLALAPPLTTLSTPIDLP